MDHQKDAVAEPVTMESLNENESHAVRILSDICSRSGLAIDLEPTGRHSPYLDVNLTGDDAAASFGRHGHSLDALQYLTNLIVGRRVGPDVRLILDADSYRARRADKLRSLALELAEQVIDRREECELDPLPAHERRIIHNTLTGVPGIRTYSEGDDPDRRVIIAPG